MKTILHILILFFCCTLTLSSQTAYRLTVGELFERGLQNSITIQSSIVKSQISEDKVGLAKNRRLPDISVGGLFGYTGTPVILDKDFSFMKRSDTPDWKQNYQVTATQPIYQGGRIKNNIEKAELEKEIAELSLQKDKSDLKLWLMGKYLDLFNLYKHRDVYTQNIEEAKTRLRDIEKMKEQGMITTNDVLRSQLVLTNYQLAYKETENDIALISQQLDIVLGLDESTILEPDSSLLKSRPEINMENDYVRQAYTQYPDLKIMEKNIALAQNNLKLTKADYLPTLSLQASNTLARPVPNISPAQDLYMNAWGVTLNLSYHISSLFDRKHNTNAAKSLIQLEVLAQEQQKQNIRTDVKLAYVKHQEALDRIDALKKSVEQANENYRIVKNKYFNQLAILTDLLDANNVQLNAELELTAAKTNAIYTYYQLQKVSGNL
ncbi:TolC family protein [Prevotella sp. 10(H)]|uniref:TolC family protein n=1 Tax=Prevotella sp. 10(H) TaxID=1158294 RepID=UPI0004A724BD|nr:TolC family protein [Prevotella sp. 10(H)]